MREIKFRAWIHEISNFECDNKPCMSTDFTFEEYMSVNDALYVMQAHNHILMQYTGLRDKNGVEIYEGDIIGREKDDTKSCVSHHVVEWHDTGFMGRQVCSYGSYIGLGVWTQHKDGYVVLGNVYENPELLQEVTK